MPASQPVLASYNRWLKFATTARFATTASFATAAVFATIASFATIAGFATTASFETGCCVLEFGENVWREIFASD